MRRADFGTLSSPEFSLRGLPRMTVRGHPVQGDSVPLRKAPLRSRVAPWSTKRICGPLAFRRATEGSRVLRKGRGVKRGRETLVSLPLLSPPGDPGIPPPPGGGTPHAMSWRITPCPGGPLSPAAASRRNGGTAHPLLRVKAMGRKVASSGAPLYRRKVHRQQTVKKRHGRPNGGKSPPSAKGKIFFIFPLDRFVLLYYYHSTT